MAKKQIRDEYREKAIAHMLDEGWDDDYIEDWERVYDETGLDMRDMADGMDVDAFLDAYERGDIDEMIMLS